MKNILSIAFYSALLAFLLVLGPTETLAVKYTRCGLAKELKNLGFSDLGNWVCLAESESTLITSARGGPNPDGSFDYGIFQINSRYWCSTTAKPGKDCNMTCKSLLDDSIRNDAACARIIFRRHGFSAWYGWQAKCRGEDVSAYVRGCGV